jgi:hypothetical protein
MCRQAAASAAHAQFACLPACLPACLQSERRHLALSDLDHRITILFFSFNLANTFTGSILGGAVFGSIGNMVNQPGGAGCDRGTCRRAGRDGNAACTVLVVA